MYWYAKVGVMLETVVVKQRPQIHGASMRLARERKYVKGPQIKKSVAQKK